MTAAASVPYTVRQVPFVVLSVFTKVALFGGAVIENVAVAIALSSILTADAMALTVVVDDNVRELVYTGDELVGGEPSVVYRMTAPGVADASVTVTGVVKEPPDGLIVGVATVGSWTTNDALPTALSSMFAADAIALTVVDVDTVKGPEYCGEATVGVEPSTV